MLQWKAVLRTIAACAIIYFCVKLSFLFMSPFILSLLICIAAEPIIKVLVDNLHISRTLSIIVALLFFCFLSFFIIYITVHNIYKEALAFLRDAPVYYERLNILLEKYYAFLKNNFNIDYDGQNMAILNSERIILSIMNLLSNLKDKIIKAVYLLPDIIVFITFSIISAFFMLRDKHRIIGFLKKCLPINITSVAARLNSSAVNILRTEFLLVGISTVQTIIGLMMLNINYALIIGIISGILDILPVIGPGIIFIPWAIYYFFYGNVTFAVSLLCLYIIIVITRQVLETRMISTRLDMHPLIILLSVYVGLKFFGILGALLGPITAVVLKMIYMENTFRSR